MAEEPMLQLLRVNIAITVKDFVDTLLGLGVGGLSPLLIRG